MRKFLDIITNPYYLLFLIWFGFLLYVVIQVRLGNMDIQGGVPIIP
jgi:hypothetical protein